MPNDSKEIFVPILNRILRGTPPRRVHLINTRGKYTLGGTALDCPRLSLCLFGRGRYSVVPHDNRMQVELRPWEMIYIAPGCVMDPHLSTSYESLGIVFQKDFVRFLLARVSAGAKGQFLHQILHVYHAPQRLDHSATLICDALNYSRAYPPENIYARSLGFALLAGAREALLADHAQTPKSKAYFTWRAAQHYLEENLHHPISRKEIAAFLHLHPNHISRLFRQFTGRSFSDHVLESRLKRARNIMKDPRMNISEVAFACGFSSANYFIRVYRRHFNRSPGRDRDER